MADGNDPDVDNTKVEPIEDLDKPEGTLESPRRSSTSPPDDPDALVLECPICLQPCVHPVELPCKHIFCFLCIKGVAMQGPHGRCAICRSNIPHNVLTHPRLKDISQLFKHVKTTTSGYEWYYEARGGGWWQYDERSMQELERAFETQQTSCQLLIAGLLYDIDFGQMVQYRQNNRNLFRRIKRDVPSAEKRGIAGIRLGRNGDNGSSQNNTGGGGSNGSNDGTAPTHDNGRRGRGGRSRGSFNRPSRQGTNTGDSLATSDSVLTSIENVVVLSESESDNAEEEEDSDDDPDYLEEEEEEDMELGEEEELRESSDEEGADVDLRESAIRDGARAPTSRSDRSNSSTTQTPPPNEVTNGGTSGSSPRNQNSSPNSNPSGRRSRGARSDRSSRSKSGLGSTGGNGSVNNPEPSSSASSPEVPPQPPQLLMGGIRAVSATNIRISSAPSSLENCSSANFSLDPNPNINGSYSNLTNINGSSRSSITTTADFTCLLIGPGVRITLDQDNPPTNDEEIL